MEAVTPLLTMIHKIIKAAETVHDNEIRCQRLAVRAHGLGVIVSVRGDSPTSTTAASVTALLTTSPLESLTAVLADALELVEACQLRKSGFLGWVEDLLTSESMAIKFQDVDTRISACVVDLDYAQGEAARLCDERHHAKAHAPPAQEAQRQQQQRYQAQSTPPVKPSKQPWPSSRFLEQSAPSSPPSHPLPPSLQQFLKQSAPPPPPPQPLPPSLQEFLKQSAPPSPPPQPLPPSLQQFLKQSAPPSPPPFKQSAQPLPPSLQRFLKESAPPPQQHHNVVQPLPQVTPLLQQRSFARSALPPKLPQQHRTFVLPPVPQPQQRYSTRSPPYAI